MKKLFISASLSIFFILMECNTMLMADSFNPGDLYVARDRDIYLVNDYEPSDNTLFISGLNDTAHQITFSYKNGSVDHMFITDGSKNHVIKEYNADGQLVNSWTLSGTYLTGIYDIKPDIENGTTKNLYLTYKDTTHRSWLSKLNISTGEISHLYNTLSTGIFNALALTIPQQGQTGNIVMSDNYKEEIYEIDVETGAILQTMDHWSIDQTRGIDFERNADGTTSDYFYALEDRGGDVQVVKIDLTTGSFVNGNSTASNNLGYAKDVAVTPIEGAPSEYVKVLQSGSYTFNRRIVSFHAGTLANHGNYEDPIFLDATDFAYVHYGWEGFSGDAIPEPATMILLGISAIGLLFKRKRN